MNLDIFPAINATLNGTAAVFLTAGFIAIKFRNNQRFHTWMMICAFTMSVFFLGSYLTYHFLKDGLHTRLGAGGFIAVFYYVMLISHILLAMINLPMVITTLVLAIRKKYKTHQAWARWTFPIWYYVSITGVLVYLFLYQWFPGERV